jgi:hypothetical protein
MGMLSWIIHGLIRTKKKAGDMMTEAEIRVRCIEDGTRDHKPSKISSHKRLENSIK